MNENKTLIAVILDRSGSMGSIRSDVEGGFNEFIKTQADVPGECSVSLYRFDTEYESVYKDVPVKDVQPLVLIPRGSTALLDAIGTTINSVGATLSDTPEEQRPGKVMVVIITDGKENASREFSRADVFDKITHQTEKYNWQFTFLGANQDSIAEASSIGIHTNSVTFSASSVGTKALFRSVSQAAANYRSAGPQASLDVSQALYDAQLEEVKNEVL